MLEQNIKYSSRLILNYFSANQVKNSNLKNNTSTAFCTINLNHYWNYFSPLADVDLSYIAEYFPYENFKFFLY